LLFTFQRLAVISPGLTFKNSKWCSHCV